MIEVHLFAEQFSEHYVKKLREQYVNMMAFDTETSRKPIQKRYM